MSTFSLTSWVRRALGSFPAFYTSSDSYSGKPVTVDASLGLSAVWACVSLLAESIASLPCGVFENDSAGDKKLLRDSELYRLLHDQPNADMTAYDFWCCIVGCRLLYGNAYGLKTYRGTGASRKLVSIEPLRPDLMSVEENTDGSFRYIYHDSKGRKQYSEDEIWHLKGFSLNGRIGLSVIGFARNSFGNAIAIEESSGRLYARGMTKTGILTVDKALTKEQRDQFKENIAGQFTNLGKTGGTMVLESGMKFEALSLPPEDAQLIQSRAFGIEEICRWFRVPPQLIGHTEKSTTWGTGLEQLNLGFLTYTLRPLLKSIEQEIRRGLFSPGDRAKMFAEFNIDAFMQADAAGRAALYASGTQNGWIQRSEVRKKENLPYLEGSDGLTVQSALVPLAQLGKTSVAGTIEDTQKV